MLMPNQLMPCHLQQTVAAQTTLTGGFRSRFHTKTIFVPFEWDNKLQGLFL